MMVEQATARSNGEECAVTAGPSPLRKRAPEPSALKREGCEFGELVHRALPPDAALRGRSITADPNVGLPSREVSFH
jgi:hypothetical protein